MPFIVFAYISAVLFVIMPEVHYSNNSPLNDTRTILRVFKSLVNLRISTVRKCTQSKSSIFALVRVSYNLFLL